MRPVLAAVIAVLAGAVLAAGASAKDANVELSSTPAGIGPGDPWTPVATVFQAGDRPSSGSSPTLRIENTDGDAKTFASRPTGQPGRYRFHVFFPSAGMWRYEVHDGVSGRTYTFPAALIAAPAAEPSPAAPARPAAAPVGDSDSFPLWPVAGGSLGALAGMALAWRFARAGRLGASAPGA
jgi:hypothetical protein